jgi:hypothetical protein
VVFIIVAVQNGLDKIREGLKNKGYKVVNLEGYNYPIDALVYEGNSFQISHISSNNMPEMTMGTRSSYGVFMVNAAGKSLDEVEAMLKTRKYSPLF